MYLRILNWISLKPQKAKNHLQVKHAPSKTPRGIFVRKQGFKVYFTMIV